MRENGWHATQPHNSPIADKMAISDSFHSSAYMLSLVHTTRELSWPVNTGV